MQFRKLPVMLITTGFLLVIGTGIWLASAQPVHAQCGSQASSCKNCHETQAQDPVNNDGTTWHSQHAFGDFCYLCHAGNNQAADKAAAHTGMVDPLKDVVSACKSCHAADFQAKAQIYATTLGVKIGTGAATPAAAASQPATTPTASISAAAVQAVAAVPAGTLVDYLQRYNEDALGQKPVNVGNVILIVMIVLLILGGGGFMIVNEKLVRFRFKVAFGDTRKVPHEGPIEYPVDVLDMLPAIAVLDPRARKSLKNILDKSEKTDRVLHLIEEVISDSKVKE